MKLTLEIETTDDGLIGSENEKILDYINKHLRTKEKKTITQTKWNPGDGMVTVKKKLVKSFSWKLE